MNEIFFKFANQVLTESFYKFYKLLATRIRRVEKFFIPTENIEKVIELRIKEFCHTKDTNRTEYRKQFFGLFQVFYRYHCLLYEDHYSVSLLFFHHNNVKAFQESALNHISFYQKKIIRLHVEKFTKKLNKLYSIYFGKTG